MIKRLKRVALAATVVCAAAGTAWGDPGIDVVGISPHEIETEALHDVWADVVPTPGLPTFEVGERVILEASEDSLDTIDWEITDAPDGSTLLGETGADTVFTFVTDSIGSYEVSLVVNDEVEAVTLWITAAEYVGVGTIAGEPEYPQCAVCHDDKAATWENTSHSYATEVNLTTSYMNQSCMQCHATNFDSTAWADDFGFTFPTPGAGVYDSVVTNHPEQAVLFNVQCESCHGPGSEHGGTRGMNEISDSFSIEVCAQCHDEPDHHPQPVAWGVSAHSDDVGSRGRSSCSRCHTAQGFVGETIEGGVATTHDDADPITCAACHDPHDKPGAHNLRRGSVATACTGCHTLRLSGYSGIHHSNQGSMLLGEDGMELPGYDYPVSAHSSLVSDACAQCHMADLPDFIHDAVDAEEISIGEASRVVGGHTFAVEGMWDFGEGEEEFVNDTGCIECHGSVDIEFVKISKQSIVDLLEELAALMPKYEARTGGFDSGAVQFSGANLTEAEAAAGYNYYFVANDGSYGVHNHDYAASLLRASITEVQKTSTPGEIVSITDVPNDQGNMVRVLWNAFPAEESSTDPIETYQVVRWDDALGEAGEWVIVGEVTANGMGRYALDVANDVNSIAIPITSEFMVLGIADEATHESLIAEGWSKDNIEPMAPPAAKYVSDSGELTWALSPSTDVKYYAIFRGEIGGALGVTPWANVSGVDTSVAVESGFRYGIAAVDFGENMSDPAALVVDVVNMINGIPVPATTALLGNAPNPFNPDTQIRYQLHEPANVTLTVFNVLGQPVRTLVTGNVVAGVHSSNWDGRNNTGLSVGTGAYLYVMTTESGFRATGRMLLLR